MGASVGVFLDQMSPELKEATELSEKQKYTIAEYDAAMLDRETAKVFKKHNKIIKTLTSRTKAQLRRTLSVKTRVPEDIYKIVGGNNNYAMFMKQLHMSKQEIEMENLKASSKTELYDEEMLINIIGTSSNKELKAFCELYEKEKGTPLSEVFIAKTKADSQLRRFIALCWTFNRDEGKNVDEGLAAEQAADIHKAGAARLLGCDEDLIFKILTTNSRAQCAAIADQYLTQFNMKFERAINMKFKGNCGKLMLLWALPLPTAIITCIHSYEERMIIDKVAIISMVSKYDKDVLAQVDIAAEKTYEKNLLAIVQRGLSGNLLKAVQGWIENATPDKGYERVTELFLETQQSFGRSLEDLFKNSEFQQRLLFLLKKANEEVDKYMKENRIKFNPNDKLDLRALGSIGTMDSFDAHHATDGIKVGEREVLNKYSKKEPEERATTEYDTKYKAVQNYFKAYFSAHDKKKAGLFEESEFWELLKQAPLEALGLTAAEVDAMAEFSEWVIDGRVNYHEAIFELADSVLTCIENKTSGETDVLTVMADLSKDTGKITKASSEQKVTRHESVEEIMEVPDYFLQYIYDTFFAYDFDNNGYLCKTELDSVLPVLNLGMTYTDFIKNDTDRIIHKEAVQIIARKVQPFFLDKENDNYICLVDKDSGLFFWFNCKDESSQWADNEGEGWAGYGSRRASTLEGGATFTNSLMDAALGPGIASPAQKSPRPPTSADEKETEAAVAAQAKTGDGIATKGIAEMGDGEADAKTAETTPPESEKKEDTPAAAAETKDGNGSSSPRASSPRAVSPRAASVKVPAAEAGAIDAKETADAKDGDAAPASPRAASPRAASVKVPAVPTAEAKAEESAAQASPRGGSPRAASVKVPASASPRGEGDGESEAVDAAEVAPAPAE